MRPHYTIAQILCSYTSWTLTDLLAIYSALARELATACCQPTYAPGWKIPEKTFPSVQSRDINNAPCKGKICYDFSDTLPIEKKPLDLRPFYSSLSYNIMATFSGPLKLTDLDDFITPSQVRWVKLVCESTGLISPYW